jgi:3,4-dihydroxy 2-butanone 4-phosphate synthase/GTP cyclohydrolase II
MTTAPVERALADLRAGKLIVVVDDEDRENEGDLVCAAESVTPEIINFMVTQGRGFICLALTPEDCARLNLQQMVEHNTESMATAFTVTIDGASRHGVTTGISASDRATTIKVAIDPTSSPDDLVKPGHISPLRARPGGVLQRVGHTEASVDMARLAGFRPAGVICEIMADDGSMARLPQLEAFCEQHGLSLVSVADLVAYRLRTEKLVHRVADARLPTAHGEWRVIGYQNDVDSHEHVALVHGDVEGEENVLVRIHSRCLTGDVFHSMRCDCGVQFDLAMAEIQKAGRGVIVYLDQEGRGIGLLNKLRAYELQDAGDDTVQANERLGFKADLRDFGIGAQILGDLGLSTMRVMTNNPRKMVGLEGYGLEIVERVPLLVDQTPENSAYLATKRDKLGHLFAG